MGHSFVYCWSGKFPNDFKYSGHYRPVIIIVSERLPNLIEMKTAHHQTPGSSGKDGKTTRKHLMKDIFEIKNCTQRMKTE